MHADNPTSGPLAGIKVVDLTRGMPGAIATMLLADYGADVLKLENPSGDLSESAAAYRVWNRGKKSVALDLGEAEAQRVALKLAVDADVFLESFQPGVAERLGLGYALVRDINQTIALASPKRRRRRSSGCARMRRVS